MINRVSLRWGFLAALILMVCASCEKMVIDEEEQPEKTSNANLILRVSKSSFHPYDGDTKTVVDMADYCSRFNFVLYQDGKKVEAVTQMKDEAGNDFGQVAMTVSTGTYQLMVLAHSSVGGNPVLSHPEEIQFTNQLGYSDTFYYYGTIEVTTDQTSHDIMLNRATTMVRLNFDETFPENIKYFLVKYTGESGVLNTITGYGGKTNSQQEKLVNVSSYAGKYAKFSMPIYTFMRHDTGSLKIRMIAFDFDSIPFLERSYDNVPIEHTKATDFVGEFFEHETQQAFSFKLETDWEVSNTLNFSDEN